MALPGEGEAIRILKHFAAHAFALRADDGIRRVSSC